MVHRKNLKKKFALISVFEKKNLKYLCDNLNKYNYNFISSGSTGKKIRSLGFKCEDISKLTKFKEMFNGRVKTINPLIYAPLLYVRNDKRHRKQFLSLNKNSNNTFLQETYKRLEGIKNLNEPMIICNEMHRFIVAEQMREIKINN